MGNEDHRGGYHCGRDRVDPDDDYSVVESSRDQGGLSYAASAVDWGWWQTVVHGKTHNLRTYSYWLVEQCKKGTPDSKHIREVIYSLDGKVVKRWDRLGQRTSGDSSHLYHTHESHFRDTEKHDKLPLYRRYLEEIGLIDVALSEDDKKWMKANIGWDRGLHDPVDGVKHTAGSLLSHVEYNVIERMTPLSMKVDGLTEKVDRLLANPSTIVTDEQIERALRKVLGSLDSTE